MVLVQLLVIIMLLVSIPSALAAQMDVHIPWDSDKITPSYKFLRVVVINYEDGGNLAEQLSGKHAEISFSADLSTDGTTELIEKINTDLFQTSSNAMVTDVILHYQSSLIGRENTASIEYNIELIPTLIDYDLGGEPKKIDAQWRGIKISGPVLIDTEYGQFDVNSMESAFKIMIPNVLEDIKKTDAQQILDIELLDASGILSLSLPKWHFLFDPTAILVGAVDAGYNGTGVISHYSMGECKIGIDDCKDRTWKQKFVLDTGYTISAIESQDDATISIDGYAKNSNYGGIESFGITPDNPEIGRAATEQFPVSVIYGMAGAAGIGTIAILLFSNYKLKKEEGMGQRGIDPSQLRIQTTSSSAGSYQTNRGESHLVSEDVEHRGKNEEKLTRGTMPKDWNQKSNFKVL